MVKFPTPKEVEKMREENQKSVIALVDRFVTMLRPLLAESRHDPENGWTHLNVPDGFLHRGAEWNVNHTIELTRRMSESGWELIKHTSCLYPTLENTHLYFRVKGRLLQTS